MNDLRGIRVKYVFNVIFLSVILSCNSGGQMEADLLVSANRIYLCDTEFSKAEAMVIKNGKILATGSKKALKKQYKVKQEQNYEGYIYPGLIDAHSHLTGYSTSSLQLDLKNTVSLEDIIQKTVAYAQTHQEGWIIGRGWDNTSWSEQGFPNNTKLSLLFPDRPVVLRRIDGHAALVNQKALEIAGITSETQIEGGSIELRNGFLTGILIDNAVDLVLDQAPDYSLEFTAQALLQAQERLYAVGLTTVTDAGLDLRFIQLIDSLQQSGNFKLRTYIMANPSKENFDYWLVHGGIRNAQMEMHSFKLYADGSLGSRGAMLKEDYCDMPGHSGFWLTPLKTLDSICNLLYNAGFQVNTHCIGDSANRQMMEIYGKYLNGPNPLRWRIEHAQVVSPEDRDLFLKYAIIPSVQPTHATSDMNWAEKRLCSERMAGAYAYKSLLQLHGYLPLGTDFPVEDISPFYTYYAAVYRQDHQQNPRDGFIKEEALSPKEALWGMTLWAAKGCFMEDRVGSLEIGKSADFIVTGQDFLYKKDAYKTTVLQTWIEGEKVYEKF